MTPAAEDKNLPANLALPIENLKSVGARNKPRLNRLGIKTLKDLLWHFPTRYENFSETTPIAEITPEQKVNVQGEIIKISTRKLFPRRLFVTDAIIRDTTGAVKVVWFNQPYIENQLPEGMFVSLAGKVKVGKSGQYLSSPTYEKISGDFTGLRHTKGLVPVYPETSGITSKYLRFLIKPILAELKLNDYTPKNILDKYNYPDLLAALKAIHSPENEEDAKLAKERLAFDDLMLFQIKALLERRKMNQLKSVPIAFDEKLIKEFVADLPFELTKDQKTAAWEIFKDMERKYPMNRLMEGDVGSGKTVVALMAALAAVKAGYQAVILAPTEVLAQQHYRTIAQLAKGKMRTALLTASNAILDGMTEKKPFLKKVIAKGMPMLVVGTHAVIQKDVRFGELALVVLDEQHRFGVNQRAALIKNRDTVPHLLSMTATPIPRTLALTIYGDLDISIIREKPANRQTIVTKCVTPSEKKFAYKFIRDEVAKGRQVFVVCPRIEASDPQAPVKTKAAQSKMNILWQEVKAVQDEYEKLSNHIFPDLKVAMLHGKLKPKEKDRIMSDFKDGKYHILVSTSVIEVGVDVPNATIMMIESADRFGLAQLHQFRGRVGRGEHQSYCMLMTSTEDKDANRRLKALTETDDGFALAEKDMAIRGPGEFLGTKQSGMPDLAMASLANVELIKRSRLEARTILKEDPSLKNYPLLRQRLDDFQKMTHFE